MVNDEKGLSKFFESRLSYALPLGIAAVYMLVFGRLDGYGYPISAADDQGLFQRIALNILKNGAFSGSLGGRAFFCPIRPPLYPFIIALTWKTVGSTSLLPIRLTQGIAYLLSIYFIARISTALAGGDRRYGQVSALIASLMPFGAAAAHVILSESLALFFLTLSVFLAVRLRTKSSSPYLLMLGASLGLLTLQRPTFILLPPIFICYILLSPRMKKKDVLTSSLMLVFSFAAVLAPWILYSRSETGSFSPVMAGAGANIMGQIILTTPELRENFSRDWERLQTNHPANQGTQGKADEASREKYNAETHEILAPPDTLRQANSALATYLKAWDTNPPGAQAVIKADKFLKNVALLWIRDHPRQFLGVVKANAVTLLFGNYQPLIYQILGGYPYLHTLMLRWGLYLFFGAGTLLLFRQRRFHILFFPLAICFYIIIVHSLMHTEPRYFMYAYSFMPMTVPALLFNGPQGLRAAED